VSIFQQVGLLVGGQVLNVLLRRGRSIAGIIPQVVLEEHHHDEMVITSHPVQNGANITDHSYKAPATVTMRCGWSDSASVFNLGMSLPTVKDAYDQLLALQDNREPFDLVTGKRTYKNMLLKSLDVTTDKDSENALFVEAQFQQVIIVDTAQTTLKPQAELANPEKNTPTSDVGVKQPQQQPESILFKMSKGVQSIFGG
jgi:hypothetical protein